MTIETRRSIRKNKGPLRRFSTRTVFFCLMRHTYIYRIMSNNREIPKCERMKSRNDSFDNMDVAMDGDDDDDDNNHNNDDDAVALSEAVDANFHRSATANDRPSPPDEDCLHFFDATQYLNNREQQQPKHKQRDNRERATSTSRSLSEDERAASKAEEELQEAVAYSGALVGENVLDSPTTARQKLRAARTAGGRNPLSASSPAIPCLRERSDSRKEMDPGLSAGLVAQGFAWVRTQREARRRQYLQYQAEQQLRKIKAAKNAERQAKDASSKGLFSNPIFQNIRVSNGSGDDGSGEGNDLGRAASGSRSDTDKELDEFLDAEDGRATVSQSGMGYTVELAVSDSEEDKDASWIPPVRIEDEDLSEENLSPCLLSEEQRQQIAQHVLPPGIAYAKWKRIYSLARDGDSFDTCLRLVKGYNQSLLIIRTTKNELFGGYADASWEQSSLAGAQFYGGSNSCLFSVPDNTKGKIKAYKWTGANRYIQLTDSHRKVLAFGGGGEEGSFGLCVQSDFQRGSTGPCETFGNQPLCNEENFFIVDVEIFGFLLGQF